MKTKIIINPEYQYLEEFIRNLPDIFNVMGEVIQNKRNVIKQLNVDSLSLNIKRFRKPIFINRIIYSFFRKTKAYRAYHNAIAVEQKGFLTPTAIAYIEEYEGGLLSNSYFVSEQITNVKEIREYFWSEVPGNEQLFSEFAQYTAQLHGAGILHLDYSPGNILISENEGKYQFTLVDINRMHFEEVDIKKGCENFSRLFKLDSTYIYLAKEYAKERNMDIQNCIKYFLFYKHRFEQRKDRKRRLKQYFGKG